MKLATWNVNSARARLQRIIDFLQREDIDVLAIQETKCRREAFPYHAFEQAGYRVVAHGLNQWNGVAIAARQSLELSQVQTNFPGQPAYGNPGKAAVVEPRCLKATVEQIEVYSLYVPNGRTLDHPHYHYKLAWLEQLRQVVAQRLIEDPQAQLALVGDWNVAPYDHDVWDIQAFEGATHVSAPERQAFFAFESAGFTEVTRDLFEGYTYWDYTKLRFVKNHGMRIDFAYCSPALAARIRAAQALREERKGKGASDHIPIVLSIE